MVDNFFEEIRLSLESGNKVKLSGFGSFELRDKSSRPGRNPKTGESVAISARRVVAFKPGQKLRARVEKRLRIINKIAGKSAVICGGYAFKCIKRLPIRSIN